ncbi:hypothetical protein C8Q79DRAFT_1012709 [Trametes meyenii]|nr:hypothetical protein C8Q79DRAFT_1012709 [Trametes meyenii]
MDVDPHSDPETLPTRDVQSHCPSFEAATSPDPVNASALCPPYHGMSLPEEVWASYQSVTRPISRGGTMEVEQERYASYARRVNAIAPINRLPIELLVKIFSHVQAFEDENTLKDDSHLNWTSVLRVCQYWFTVASTTPTLWRMLYVKEGTNLLRTGLARSGNMEFDVVTFPVNQCIHDHPLRKALDLVTPHTSRLQRLHLGHIPRERAVAFHDFLEHSFPMLCDLCALYGPERRSGTELQLDFPPERFPRLQRLDLRSIRCFDDPRIFAQLRFFHTIYAGSVTYPPLCADLFMTALNHMQNMEDLSIIATNVESAPHDISVTLRARAELPRLRTIKVDTPQMHVSQQVLSSLVVPVTAQATFSFHRFPSQANRGIRNVLTEDRSALPVLSQLNTAFIRITPHGHFVDGYVASSLDDNMSAEDQDGYGHIRLACEPRYTDSIQEDTIAQDFLDCLDALRDAQLEELSIITTPEGTEQANWKALFTSHPTLRRICLYILDPTDGSPNLLSFFSALARGSLEDGDGHGEPQVLGGLTEARVLSPNLETIRIHGVRAGTTMFFQCIVACLENRRHKLGKPDWKLKELSFFLMPHQDQVPLVDSEMEAACKEALAPVVTHVNYGGYGMLDHY